jgi:hypothetical protein
VIGFHFIEVLPYTQCLLRIAEQNRVILDLLKTKVLWINNIVDYTSAEEDGLKEQVFLDRQFKSILCSVTASRRRKLFIEFCEDFDYAPVFLKPFKL